MLLLLEWGLISVSYYYRRPSGKFPNWNLRASYSTM